ncbi:MAG: hypothetical protein BWY74_01944 [Firmicutes bacterium ADurb.Bin419]|nr:MAG: hypothetical protein BWY74_01944 [Firmicutes bacterium ADurb.Bin419]
MKMKLEAYSKHIEVPYSRYMKALPNGIKNLKVLFPKNSFEVIEPIRKWNIYVNCLNKVNIPLTDVTGEKLADVSIETFYNGINITIDFLDEYHMRALNMVYWQRYGTSLVLEIDNAKGEGNDIQSADVVSIVVPITIENISRIAENIRKGETPLKEEPLFKEA